MRYFPDALPKGRHYDRTYFFMILNHLQPKYTRDIIAHATSKRMTADPETEADKAITVNEEWSKKLMEPPFISQVSILNNSHYSFIDQGQSYLPPQAWLQACSQETQA